MWLPVTPISQASLPSLLLAHPDPGQAALLFLPTPSCPQQNHPSPSLYSFCPSGGGASVQARSIERGSPAGFLSCLSTLPYSLFPVPGPMPEVAPSPELLMGPLVRWCFADKPSPQLDFVAF